MKHLLDNKLAPLTFAWGFLEASVDAVIKGYVRWQRTILHSVKIQTIDMPLADALRQLEPLDMGSRRVLFLSTKGRWTACFDNGARGGNPSTFVGVLSERLKAIVSKKLYRRARIIGAAIRAAHMLSIGRPGIIDETPLPFPAEVESVALAAALGPQQVTPLAVGVAETIEHFRTAA